MMEQARNGATITLPARPEAITIDTKATALIIVDMQNAYASPGGYLDLAGFDISGAAPAIARIAEAAAAARAAAMPLIFFQNDWDADYVEAGRPRCPPLPPPPPATDTRPP